MNTYPDDADGDALARIKSEGSDMSRPMFIDFFVAVPSFEMGEAVANAVKALGFVPSVECDDETGEWTCYATKSMVPTYEAIVEAQAQLADVSDPFQGYPDGWGSYGNKPPT